MYIHPVSSRLRSAVESTAIMRSVFKAIYEFRTSRG